MSGWGSVKGKVGDGLIWALVSGIASGSIALMGIWIRG